MRSRLSFYVEYKNYGEFNDEGFLYLNGDEFTDGSVRFTLDEETMLITLSQKRVAGVWVLNDIQQDHATWVIDDTNGLYVLNENGGQVYVG